MTEPAQGGMAGPAQGDMAGPAQGDRGEPGRSAKLKLAWGLSAHARRLLTLGLAALAIAIITRRAEFAGAAAPALLLLAAWRRDRPVEIVATIRPSSARVFEDEQVAVEVEVKGLGAYQVELVPHPHESIECDPAPVLAEPTGPGAVRGVVRLRVERWGRRPAGMCEIILRDKWRFDEGRALLALPQIDCYPRPATQRTRVVLSRLQNRLGEHPARVTGEGLEFGGVREYVPGDRQRRINWPATTRRGGRLQVNTFAAERSQDVLLLVDASCDVGERGATPLDLALRGATAAAQTYLSASDRVGLITYQWGVRWLAPGHGGRHFLRIAEAILAGPPNRSRDTRLDVLPRSAVPPGALVLVFSPLLDQKFIETLRDLRERGHMMLVIDVLNSEPEIGRSSLGKLSRKFWKMEQEAIRFSLHELGIAVVHWDGKQTLDLPLAPYTRRPLAARSHAGA
jgi:uncharacterized protein (DUF58 family)